MGESHISVRRSAATTLEQVGSSPERGIGDRFTILNRVRSLGTFTTAEMPLGRLVQMMAGDGESPQPAGKQDTRGEETDS